MTKDEFEKRYAENSGVSVSQLREMGLIAVPCDCSYEGCHGWKMISPRQMIIFDLGDDDPAEDMFRKDAKWETNDTP